LVIDKVADSAGADLLSPRDRTGQTRRAGVEKCLKGATAHSSEPSSLDNGSSDVYAWIGDAPGEVMASEAQAVAHRVLTFAQRQLQDQLRTLEMEFHVQLLVWNSCALKESTGSSKSDHVQHFITTTIEAVLHDDFSKTDVHLEALRSIRPTVAKEGYEITRALQSQIDSTMRSLELFGKRQRLAHQVQFTNVSQQTLEQSDNRATEFADCKFEDLVLEYQICRILQLDWGPSTQRWRQLRHSRTRSSQTFDDIMQELKGLEFESAVQCLSGS